MQMSSTDEYNLGSTDFQDTRFQNLKHVQKQTYANHSKFSHASNPTIIPDKSVQHIPEAEEKMQRIYAIAFTE
jgi:hypothetical protein